MGLNSGDHRLAIYWKSACITINDMASFCGFVKRFYTVSFLFVTVLVQIDSLLPWLSQATNPPKCALSTESTPIRFGILGAANIAPSALILPARSHPEVVVHAVAARSLEKAKAYAAKYEIENAYGGPNAYQRA